jgi:hypothetical protein
LLRVRCAQAGTQPALLAARASRLVAREASTIAVRGPAGPRIAYQALPRRPARTPKSAPLWCAVFAEREMLRGLVIKVTPMR